MENSFLVIDFILSTIREAAPLIYCALGVLIAEEVGIMHIGVEGVMLVGALAGILGVIFGGNIWVGLFLTLVAGVLCGLILSLFLIWLPIDQVAVGIAFNLAALGFTSYIFRLCGMRAQKIVPIIKPLFLKISPFELMAFIMAFFTWWFLFKTASGLKIRSIGENMYAADAMGIDVIKVRTVVFIIACVFSAFGGAALTLGWVRVFADNITMGRGFIALAAVYFAKWYPLFVLIGALIFGAGESLAFRSQATISSINQYYFFMLPYALTILIIGLSGKSHGPAEVGKHFIRR